jgi:hypothetical protein
MCLPTFAKPVLYEVPTYLAQNSNLNDKKKNKKKKSDGKKCKSN